MKSPLLVLTAWSVVCGCGAPQSLVSPTKNVQMDGRTNAASPSSGAQANVSPYLQAELAEILARKVADSPTLEDVGAIVRNGIPKPAEDYTRASLAHSTFSRWGRETLTAAFRAVVDPVASQRQQYAAQVARTLQRLSQYGVDFGDFTNRAFDYGNVNLELIWFMGNIMRAAYIVQESPGSSSGLFKEAISDQTRENFIQWLAAVESRYMNTWVYASGRSNRKASQIEVMMRSALFRRDEMALQQLFRQTFVTFVNTSITERGLIPEDSGRDKYHPQFFLASAMQILDLAKSKGLTLRSDVPAEKLARGKLHAALVYAALTNQNDRAPVEFPKMADAKANYEIPFWYLAGRFFNDYQMAIPPAVTKMIEANYREPSRFDFAMMWGFNAIATAYRL